MNSLYFELNSLEFNLERLQDLATSFDESQWTIYPEGLDMLFFNLRDFPEAQHLHSQLSIKASICLLRVKANSYVEAHTDYGRECRINIPVIGDFSDETGVFWRLDSSDSEERYSYKPGQAVLLNTTVMHGGFNQVPQDRIILGISPVSPISFQSVVDLDLRGELVQFLESRHTKCDLRKHQIEYNSSEKSDLESLLSNSSLVIHYKSSWQFPKRNDLVDPYVIENHGKTEIYYNFNHFLRRLKVLVNQ